ncbi:MAG: flagellar FliJ family protein [Anaerolineaceae bacterium]
MPPKFSLQGILDYRHSRVEILEVVLSKAMHVHQQAIDELGSLEVEQGRLLQEMAESQKGELDLKALSHTRFMSKKIQGMIARQHEEINRLASEVEKAKQILIQAKQDEQVMVTLSEKELLKFTEKQYLQDKQQQDDVYISKAHSETAKKLESRMQNVRFVF